uniref:Uncharacterized protein n=1 Tax=Arundo donax TaxID=35708 RepID=A0A0A9BPG3_ARUDO
MKNRVASANAFKVVR